MQYWMVVTSPENFRHDREHLQFAYQGFPPHFRLQVQKMQTGDRVLYYIKKLQKFGATATIIGDYIYDDKRKLWTDDSKIWPERRPSKPDIILEDDELVDVKKLSSHLSFIKRKEYWGTYFQGSIRTIPEEDFRLVETEMKKIISGRPTEDFSKPIIKGAP